MRFNDLYASQEHQKNKMISEKNTLKPFPNKEVKSIYDEIKFFNIRIIRIGSIIALICVAIYLVLGRIIIQNTYAGFWIYILFIGLFLISYILSLFMEKSERLRKNAYNVYFQFFFQTCMAYGIYVGTIANTTNTAAIFVLSLGLANAVLLIEFGERIIATLIDTIVFIVLAVIFKEPNVWLRDVSNAITAALLSVIFGYIVTHFIVRAMLEHHELEQKSLQLTEYSLRDPLTGLYNRRKFDEGIETLTQSPENCQKIKIVIIFDIDNFKAYNDNFGHDVGDEILKKIAGVMNKINLVYPDTIMCRWGGEEFMVAGLVKKPEDLEKLIKLILETTYGLNIASDPNDPHKLLTVSAGGYLVEAGSQEPWSVIYKKADTALYQAKAKGKNAYVIYK